MYIELMTPSNARKLAFILVLISLGWAMTITGMVAAGLPWALERAAGGLYADEAPPVALQIVYAIQSASMFAIGYLEWRLFRGNFGNLARRLGYVVVVLYSISTILNAISPTPAERWNAIGAAAIVAGTLYLIRKPVG